MPIDKSEVERVAKLARVRIAPDEAESLAGDLERIVGYIDSLAGVDLPDDEESLTYFDKDVLREDRAGTCIGHEDALRNAPSDDGEFFLVPQIVDKEDG